MNLGDLNTRLEQQAQAIRALVQGVSKDEARWTPEPEVWSTLDVLNHLAYEEKHDFRARLRLVLQSPQETWPTGDPARGVTEDTRRRTLPSALRAFLSARKESVNWLASLEAPDWNATCETPFGHIKAGDIMAAWVAHDLLHARQLVELRWQRFKATAKPYSVRYAGPW